MRFLARPTFRGPQAPISVCASVSPSVHSSITPSQVCYCQTNKLAANFAAPQAARSASAPQGREALPRRAAGGARSASSRSDSSPEARANNSSPEARANTSWNNKLVSKQLIYMRWVRSYRTTRQRSTSRDLPEASATTSCSEQQIYKQA